MEPWAAGKVGFSIPAGGVLSTQAYQDFIEKNGLRQTIENISQRVTVDNVGEQETEKNLALLREKIKAGRISPQIEEKIIAKLKTVGLAEKPVAVRSSASAEDSSGASFAGVHDSFLNVRGIENILTAVKGCYASLWTTRAVAYRRKMDIGDCEISAAVVIMEMVEAKAAGIGFTCNPRTGCWDDMVINANYGLGESVVGGMIEPDEYHVDPKPPLPEIKEKRIGKKEGLTIPRATGGTELISTGNCGSPTGDYGKPDCQVLSDESIEELGLLLLRVFDSLGEGQQHQDIEWVFDGKGFVLVQARPVTVLPRCTFAGLQGQPDIWSNANLKDVMPGVQSTFGWSLYRNALDILLTPFFQAVGYEFPPGLKIIRLYKGRAYFNLAAMQWGYFDAFGISPKALNAAWGDINLK